MVERSSHGGLRAKTPTANRFSGALPWLLTVVCALAFVLVPSSVRAEESSEPLTVDQAVSRALSRSAVTASIEGPVGIAKAEAVGDALWPNPEIQYDREQLFGTGGTSGDAVGISQRIEISGRLALRHDAGKHMVRAAALESDWAKQRWVAQVTLAFYAVLAEQQRTEAMDAFISVLQRSADIVQTRREAGDVSDYDLHRINSELARATSERVEQIAMRDRAWADLAALLGEERHPGAWPRVAGELLPSAPPTVDDPAATLGDHPELLAISQRLQSATLRQRAGTRGWLPDLILGGGWKSVSDGAQRLHGYHATVGLVLPFWDHRQDERAGAEAQVGMHRAELELVRDRLFQTIRAQTDAARALHQAALDFHDRTGGNSSRDAFLKMAETGYRGGVVGILELIDAYKTDFADRKRRIELDAAARMARIELDLFVGRSQS
jgi:outer membrane protein, heavy metal efflux system